MKKTSIYQKTKTKESRMKKSILGAILFVASINPAVAEENAIEWPSVTIGAERALESEVNTLYTSTSLGPASIGVTLEDTAADTGNFSIAKYEADFEHAIGGVTLYMENDFTDEFKHSETVVGAKITF
jgi:uncharacterized Zn finger protein